MFINELGQHVFDLDEDAGKGSINVVDAAVSVGFPFPVNAKGIDHPNVSVDSSEQNPVDAQATFFPEEIEVNPVANAVPSDPLMASGFSSGAPMKVHLTSGLYGHAGDHTYPLQYMNTHIYSKIIGVVKHCSTSP